MAEAWVESQPGSATAHEEGGFILRRPEGQFAVERWPRGTARKILVPEHAGGARPGGIVVATFHTHPQAGPRFPEGPSLLDVSTVLGDPDLRHPEYLGEFVIGVEWLYQIGPTGIIDRIGRTAELLPISTKPEGDRHGDTDA